VACGGGVTTRDPGAEPDGGAGAGAEAFRATGSVFWGTLELPGGGQALPHPGGAGRRSEAEAMPSGTVAPGDQHVLEERGDQPALAVVVHQHHGVVAGGDAAGRRGGFGEGVHAGFDLGVHAGRLVVVGTGTFAEPHVVAVGGDDPVRPADVLEGDLERLEATLPIALPALLLQPPGSPGPPARGLTGFHLQHQALAH